MNNQAEPRWVAVWRHQDTLTLLEAAAWLCELEPGITYDHRDASDRRERDRRDAMHSRLVGAVKADALQADLKQWHQAASTRENWATREVTHTPAKNGTDYKASTVTRAALAAWMQAEAIPEPFPVNADDAAHSSLAPKAENTLLAIVAALAELAEYDLSSPHSEKPGNVADAVVAKIEGVKGRKVKRRTVAEWLAKARDLPGDD